MKAMDLIERFFPGGSGEITITRIPEPGASGPKIVVFTHNGDGTEWALKYGVSRVPMSRQVSNRDQLARWFNGRLVPVINHHCSEDGHEDDAILMPAFQANFNDVVNGRRWSEQDCQRVWDEILHEVSDLWFRSQVPWDAFGGSLKRNPQQRIERVCTSILECRYPGWEDQLGCYQYMPLVINGVAHPSLAHVFSSLQSAYQAPKAVVWCQGDLNANNILVNDGKEWALVDWEWAGQHDWRLSCSHLCGWWFSTAALQHSQPSMTIEGGSLVINYQSTLRPFTKGLIQSAYATARAFASRLGEDGSFDLQFRLMLSVLLLGDTRFLAARSFSAETLAYLIGEAVTIWNHGHPDLVPGES